MNGLAQNLNKLANRRIEYVPCDRRIRNKVGSHCGFENFHFK